MAGKSKKTKPDPALDVNDTAAWEAFDRVLATEGSTQAEARAAYDQAMVAARKKPKAVKKSATPPVLDGGAYRGLSRAEWLQQPDSREWKLRLDILWRQRGIIEELRPDLSPAEVDEWVNAIGMRELVRAAKERYRVEVERAEVLAEAHRKGKGAGKVVIHTELRELLAENDAATEPEVWAMVPGLDCVVEVIEDSEAEDPRCSEFLGASKQCAPTAHIHYKQEGSPGHDQP